MPIQAFVDESTGGQHFVLAALVAPSENWMAFSSDWDACLRAAPALEYFKMHEAAKLQGQFRGWSGAERDTKLRDLLRIINCYAKVIISYSVNLKAHVETFASFNRKPLNEPYFWSFQIMILAVCLDLWDRGFRERFEIIFDEHVIFGPRAKVWYPLMRDIAKRKCPEEHAIMPVDPLFRSDTEFLPLQACDLFAWVYLRICNEQDHSFDWIRDEIRDVEYSLDSHHFDRERMEAIIEQAKQLAKEISLDDEIIKAHRKIFDRDY